MLVRKYIMFTDSIPGADKQRIIRTMATRLSCQSIVENYLLNIRDMNNLYFGKNGAIQMIAAFSTELSIIANLHGGITDFMAVAKEENILLHDFGPAWPFIWINVLYDSGKLDIDEKTLLLSCLKNYFKNFCNQLSLYGYHMIYYVLDCAVDLNLAQIDLVHKIYIRTSYIYHGRSMGINKEILIKMVRYIPDMIIWLERTLMDNFYYDYTIVRISNYENNEIFSYLKMADKMIVEFDKINLAFYNKPELPQELFEYGDTVLNIQ